MNRSKAKIGLLTNLGKNLKVLSSAAAGGQKIIYQNLFLSIVVIGTLVIGAISGWFGLMAVIIGHEVSELIVIANGLCMMEG